MAENEKHWVEELFPPAFGLTVKEVLDTSKVEEEENIFDKVAKKISPLDVTAIKNVYERVWLMQHIENEEKRKQEESDDEEESFDGDYQRTSTPKGFRTLSIFQQSSTGLGRKPKTKCANTSTSDIDQKAPINVNDPCIWTTKEIEVLRKVFQTASQQNIDLKARLHIATEDYHKLTSKIKTQSSTLAVKNEKYQDAFKANERLHILCKNLKLQLDKANRNIKLVENEIETLKEERSQYLRELHEVRVAFDTERLERKKVELDLENQNNEALREWTLREENLKLLHQEDVGYLRKQMSKLKEELENEKKDHHRTTNALGHLRTHFSNLPLAGEAKPRAVVTENQLSNWTY